MNLADAPDVLTVDQVAEILTVDKKTIYEAIKSGDLRAVRLGASGRVIRIPKPALEDFLGVGSDDVRGRLRVIDGGSGDG